MFDTFLSLVTACLQDEVNAAAAQKEEFRQEAEKAQKLIHDFVEKKNENKDQMYTRVRIQADIRLTLFQLVPFRILLRRQ